MTDQLHDEITTGIEEHGRKILVVEGDNKHHPFYYTIGNHLKGAPELLLIGAFEAGYATMVINMLSDHAVQEKRPFINGQKVRTNEKALPMQIWDTTVIAKLEYTRLVSEYYQHKDYIVQQVIIPDPKGHYPTDKRCHKRYRVPVLRPTVDLMADMRSTLVH